MINSLLRIFLGGCAHKRTTFPLTPSRRSKRAEGAPRGTYVACLNCGKEFDYNWKEMRIGSPVVQLPVVNDGITGDTLQTFVPGSGRAVELCVARHTQGPGSDVNLVGEAGTVRTPMIWN
jgi:hypothetical protein